MEIKINLRDAALVVCGVAAGLLASSALINKAKKDIKKEIIAETTNTVKKDITDEIKNNVDFEDIVDNIKDDVNKRVVNDILKESKDNFNNFISTVSHKINDMKNTMDKRLDRFEDRLDSSIDQGLCIDLGSIFGRRHAGGDDDDV